MHVALRLTLICFAALAGSTLGGCSVDGPTSLAVAPGEYPLALEAARDSLRDHGFTINRVDAAAGVITTHPKGTAGLATPWDGEQSTVYQEWEDLMNRHERTVRINFVPEGEAPVEGDGRAAAPLQDLAEQPVPLTLHTAVAVERAYRSNWRIESSTIRQSRYYWDRGLSQRGMTAYEVPIAQDEKLAARLTRDIRRRMEKAR